MSKISKDGYEQIQIIKNVLIMNSNVKVIDKANDDY